MIKRIRFAIILFLGLTITLTAQNVRIMPLGNSITYDSNSLDKTNPRPEGDRISYRYRLYQLLYDGGYEFDYVGSENSGYNYFQNAELDDNAGFPAIKSYQLANLINTGYNAITGYNETPGPYLLYHPADIILLHIGTNDLITSPSEVEDILDNIRYYDPDVYILVARIINRRTYHSATTTFNNNVAQMVAMRGDPRIKMVDMESGAGINYSSDMIDDLHPNSSGYNKMGVKWFEAITSLNNKPQVTQIPEQFTDRETAFIPVSLDEFASDPEDSDQMLSWTFTTEQGTRLNVYIDDNRYLVVTPIGDWYGSETISLKVTDSGNGIFPESASMEVVFTVENSNSAPVIHSNPLTEIEQDKRYNYTIQAYDENGDAITYSVVQKPEWLEFNEVSHLLSGTPGNEVVGEHNVILRASDFEDYTDQNFNINVIDVNDKPVFISTPITEINAFESYIYLIEVSDADPGDHLDISVVTKPEWLTFSMGFGDALLFGTPDKSQIGPHAVILQVSDGEEEVLQGYNLRVLNPVSTMEISTDLTLEIYPNPTDGRCFVKSGISGTIELGIYNMVGVLQRTIISDFREQVEIDISDLKKGIYIYKAVVNGQEQTGKLIKK